MIPIIKGSRGARGARPPGAGQSSGQVQMPDIPWKGVLIAAVAIAILLVIKDSFFVVQAGERAAIYSKLSGVKHYQLAEGLHLNVPILYEPTIYDTKTLTYTMSGGSEGTDQRHGRQRDEREASDDSLIALTSDGLPVTLDISVRFHVDPENVWRLHQDIGPEFIDKVVRPQARSTTRMVFAEYPVIDVYSGKRQVIVEQIQRELRQLMAGSYIVLDEVLLRDIRFPPEFQSAIEAKQVAQQEAQQMIFEIQRAESERQQRIIEAQGEASAISKKARALAAHPQLLQYEFVQSLPSAPRVVVTDSKTIINLGDALIDAGKTSPVASEPSRRAARQPEEGAQ